MLERPRVPTRHRLARRQTPPPVLPPSLPPETGSLDDAGPLYLSLSALFGRVGKRLRRTAAPYDAETVSDVLALLGRAELNPVEWEQFAARCADRYTRNVVAVDERWPATLATEPVRCAAFGRSRRALPQRTSLERRPRSSPCSGPTRRGGAAAGAGSASATSVGRGSLVYEARLYWRSLR